MLIYVVDMVSVVGTMAYGSRHAIVDMGFLYPIATVLLYAIVHPTGFLPYAEIVEGN